MLSTTTGAQSELFRGYGLCHDKHGFSTGRGVNAVFAQPQSRR